ncbi:MAG: alkaline phosphatase [Rhodobacteraceae bacterium]|nr:alkaline phosphatase [Paracoccaceae bacterium]
MQPFRPWPTLQVARHNRSASVSSAPITRATPASLYAHSADRSLESNTDKSEGCDVPDIAKQLITQMEAIIIDMAVGGGRGNNLTEADCGSRSD